MTDKMVEWIGIGIGKLLININLAKLSYPKILACQIILGHIVQAKSSTSQIVRALDKKDPFRVASIFERFQILQWQFFVDISCLCKNVSKRNEKIDA